MWTLSRKKPSLIAENLPIVSFPARKYLHFAPRAGFLKQCVKFFGFLRMFPAPGVDNNRDNQTCPTY
jgi:hypothetical protein